MRSTFSGLELSRRTLEAQQVALDISGHNIANANTAGYTRQVANLQATTPGTVPGMGHSLSIGTGVTVESITRARDSFIDRQYRSETAKQQYWAAREDSLSKVEGILNEPSDNSLHSDLDKFWNAWSDLSKNPENMGARSVVRERALTLTDSFHHMAQQTTDMQQDLDSNVRVQIHQINVYGQQIKDLNDQIKRAEVAGDNPNDLRDKRDALVDDLSKIVNVRVIEKKDPNFTDREVNTFTLLIGDDSVMPPQAIVDDSTLYKLEEPAPAGPDGLPFAKVKWANGPTAGQDVKLGEKTGALGANLEVRGNDTTKTGYLYEFRKQLDDLARGVAEAVNTLHAQGQGLKLEGDSGILFFIIDPVTDPGNPQPAPNPSPSPTPPNSDFTAANISLNSVIEGDVGKIASGMISLDSSTPPGHQKDSNGNPILNVGDGTIAQKISSLSGGWKTLENEIKNGMFGGGNPVPAASFSDFYGANVAQTGVDVQQAKRMSDGQNVLVTHLANQRDAYSGVSLDEEMTNLVKFQKSYDAAAHLVTMYDEMLDTLINRMGVTR